MRQFDLDSFIPYRISLLADQLSAEFATRYQRQHDLSIAEWRVVAHLSQGSPVSIREITLRVGLEKSRVSRAASRLQERGYIRKNTDPKDRRLLHLSLTKKGKAMMQDLAKTAEQYQQDLAQSLDTDYSTIEEVLTRLTLPPRDR